MTTYLRRLIGCILLTATTAAGYAEAGVIFPIDPATGVPNQAAPVTVSLFNTAGQDVTDTWLPTWEPTLPESSRTVYVSFNVLGVPGTPAVTLAPPATSIAFNGVANPFLALPVTTSAYPGQCTNYGSPTDLTPDYNFNTSGEPIQGTQRLGFALVSQDCGGMAVIVATVTGAAAGTYRFVIPQDSNRNGIPDIAEARLCSSIPCPTGREDSDAGPVANSPAGDGISAFDEYRGFIVSGRHVPTDPRQRDLFIHVVNPQCGAIGESLIGGGTTSFPNDGSGLFDNLATLVPGTQVHLLGHNSNQANTTTAEWVDRFDSFTQATGFQYRDAANNLVRIAPLDDRRINTNAVFPLGVANTGGTPIQKGLRITECVDTSAASPLGTTGIGSTNGPDNSLLYTKRIQDYMRSLIANGGGRPLKVFAFENGAWVAKTKADGTVDENFVVSQAMKFYAAHELTHSTRLTPTVEGTTKTSYGYHHAPGTGSVMDQAITQKIDKSTTGFNSFYIPSVYNGADQSSYKIKD